MSLSRELPDWITEFVNAAEWGEAPQYYYFWVGAATIAAALRRQVWYDMGEFCWYPNLYTVLVAPPGVIQKSTTLDMGVKLLRELPQIKFGPSTFTWQSLYDCFLEVGEEFEIPNKNETRKQYPLVVVASELGTALKLDEPELIDQLVHMWDGLPLHKRTRKDGETFIAEPCLNLMAATTPAWVAANVPHYLIGGGLTSRMLFVYGEKKARYNAYPRLAMPPDFSKRRERLIRDLERISNLKGDYYLSPEALEWGQAWYKNFHETEAPRLDSSVLGGYISRKQTLIHKLAMILTASYSDKMLITAQTLQRAEALITQLESHMPQVYSKIGMTRESSAADSVLTFLRRFGGKAPFVLLYRYMHKTFPDPTKFDLILTGLMDAGFITLDKATKHVILLPPREDSK